MSKLTELIEQVRKAQLLHKQGFKASIVVKELLKIQLPEIKQETKKEIKKDEKE